LKRLLDIIAALAALVLFSPLFALLFVLVRCKLGSPVLFSQTRPGLNGQPFTMYKFRTMTNATDEHGVPLSDVERLTRFGKLLRSSSMDELPELWNVLKGDMSLVGPRPLLMEYLPLYTSEQAKRHQVRPGITGWSQINGRNAITWEKKFELDVWYVDNQSLLLDIKILIRTVLKVVKREGISSEGLATTEKFTGSRLR
jgi:lipopolysaccharide/colanic/teichoic acid biosynthesis glycosyltransferase